MESSKCESKTCENVAEFRFTWPGQDERKACHRCALRAVDVGQALGMRLQVIRLSQESVREQQ